MNVSTQAQGAYRLIITITSIARGPKGPLSDVISVFCVTAQFQIGGLLVGIVLGIAF